MAIIVVGGSGRGVGKTALVCGLIAALPEFAWTAVKITSHRHFGPEPVWEETSAGQQSDTARYLAAGAKRALLLTAPGDDLTGPLSALRAACPPGANLIFESNRILELLKPDLCLMVEGQPDPNGPKPSFAQGLRHADALVRRSLLDRHINESRQPNPLFELADLGQISAELAAWVRSALRP